MLFLLSLLERVCCNCMRGASGEAFKLLRSVSLPTSDYSYDRCLIMDECLSACSSIISDSTMTGSFWIDSGKKPRLTKSRISLSSSGSSERLVCREPSNFYLFRCLGRVILLIFALFWKSSEKMSSSMVALFSGLRYRHCLIIMLKSLVTPCGIGL